MVLYNNDSTKTGNKRHFR